MGEDVVFLPGSYIKDASSTRSGNSTAKLTTKPINDSVFLQKATEPIDGLKDVNEMIEKERSTRIALG